MFWAFSRFNIFQKFTDTMNYSMIVSNHPDSQINKNGNKIRFLLIFGTSNEDIKFSKLSPAQFYKLLSAFLSSCSSCRENANIQIGISKTQLEAHYSNRTDSALFTAFCMFLEPCVLSRDYDPLLNTLREIHNFILKSIKETYNIVATSDNFISGLSIKQASCYLHDGCPLWNFIPNNNSKMKMLQNRHKEFETEANKRMEEVKNKLPTNSSDCNPLVFLAYDSGEVRVLPMENLATGIKTSAKFLHHQLPFPISGLVGSIQRANWDRIYKLKDDKCPELFSIVRSSSYFYLPSFIQGSIILTDVLNSFYRHLLDGWTAVFMRFPTESDEFWENIIIENKELGFAFNELAKQKLKETEYIEKIVLTGVPSSSNHSYNANVTTYVARCSYDNSKIFKCESSPYLFTASSTGIPIVEVNDDVFSALYPGNRSETHEAGTGKSGFPIEAVFNTILISLGACLIGIIIYVVREILSKTTSASPNEMELMNQ